MPFCLFFFQLSARRRALHSFPTRRSSDLREAPEPVTENHGYVGRALDPGARPEVAPEDDVEEGAKRLRVPPVETRVQDRKSTRLNSSHRTISYAVFCLKKKKRPPAHTGSC